MQSFQLQLVNLMRVIDHKIVYAEKLDFCDRNVSFQPSLVEFGSFTEALDLCAAA